MLNLFSVIVLAIVEGLTEYLPISSTGHLILFGDLLSIQGEQVKAFDIFIQGGAILAAAILYRERFFGLLDFSRSSADRKGFSGVPGIIKVAAACAPAFLLGGLFHDKIKHHLFAPMPVAIATFVGAILILLVERRKTPPQTFSLDTITLRECVVIGIFQCLALWPGMSRSGMTILGGMIAGLERRCAAEFSFIIAVPTLLAAVAYDLLKNYKLFSGGDIPLLAVGFIISFVTAVLAIRTFVSLLGRFTLRPFAYYRIVLAIVVFVLLL